MRQGFFLITIFSSLSLCAQSQASKDILARFLNNKALLNAHAGISIYDSAGDSTLMQFQENSYFIPSSTTKLFTLYAAMKYLGDSIPALSVHEYDNDIEIEGTGDPTLLHPDFKKQPVIAFLKNTRKKIRLTAAPIDSSLKPWGAGWVWDDYNESFMAEKSEMPVFGNVIRCKGNIRAYQIIPDRFNVRAEIANSSGTLTRDLHQNNFTLCIPENQSIEVSTPFITSSQLSAELLADAIEHDIAFETSSKHTKKEKSKDFTIYSRPVDSLYKSMMYNSDNFFAEQILLMVSKKRFGLFSTELIIEKLLAEDFSTLPVKPRWVDGSGLSRYNLFSPSDCVFVLKKILDEFGFERMTSLLPFGGKGSLKNRFISDTPFIYAKTGSMSNQTALAGYLIAQSGKTLIFSMVVNNHQAKSSVIRDVFEKTLLEIRKIY